jgi:hypothetical protein
MNTGEPQAAPVIPANVSWDNVRLLAPDDGPALLLTSVEDAHDSDRFCHHVHDLHLCGEVLSVTSKAVLATLGSVPDVGAVLVYVDSLAIRARALATSQELYAIPFPSVSAVVDSRLSWRRRGGLTELRGSASRISS